VAGYSGTPLPRKLGITEGARVVVLGAPDGFELDLPAGASRTTRLNGRADVVVFFTTERAALAQRLAALTAAIRPDGGLWVAWPKKSSKVPTDITEDVVRDVALPTGVVDNKVCAIDDTWSGLRLVWRKALR
jgi:hypothetical protein